MDHIHLLYIPLKSSLLHTVANERSVALNLLHSSDAKQ